MVLDGDEDACVATVDVDLDRGAVGRELDRVVNEVVDDLLDPSHVGVDRHVIVVKGQFKGDVPRGADALEGLAGAADDRADVEIRHVEEHLAALKGVEGEHAFRELGEAVGLAEDDTDVFSLKLGRDGAILEGLKIEVRGERKSWETLAMNLRWYSSEVASSSAM